MAARRLMVTRRSQLSTDAIMKGGEVSPLLPHDAAGRSKLIRHQNGVKIFTKTWGRASSDRKVLALHGYLDNTGTFDLLGPALAKEGFEVVAMDFPGHGKSDATSNESWYGLLDYPEYVVETSRLLGWDRFALVGHSMGGGVTSLVAASFPELVEQCVSIDILGPYTANPGSSPTRLRDSIESRRILLTKKPKRYASFDAAVRHRLKSALWGEGQTMTWNGAARLVAAGSEPWKEDGQVKFTNDVRLRAPSASYLTEQSVIEYLKAIECPCLLVRGEEGMVTDTDAFLARKEAFGASGGGVLQDLVLPGKHHFHLDDNTAPLVADRVAAFLHGGEVEGDHVPATGSSRL